MASGISSDGWQLAASGGGGTINTEDRKLTHSQETSQKQNMQWSSSLIHLAEPDLFASLLPYLSQDLWTHQKTQIHLHTQTDRKNFPNNQDQVGEWRLLLHWME